MQKPPLFLYQQCKQSLVLNNFKEKCQKFQQFFLVRWTTASSMGGLLICKYYEPFKRSSKCYSWDEKHKNKENMRRERYSLKRKVKCVRFWNWLNWNVHFRAHCVCAMQFELFQELRQIVMRGWKRSRASCEAVEIRWEAWDKGPRNYLKITGFSLTSKMFREFFVSTVDKSFHFCPLSKTTLRSFEKQITTRYVFNWIPDKPLTRPLPQPLPNLNEPRH